jgi:hypothetical protein
LWCTVLWTVLLGWPQLTWIRLWWLCNLFDPELQGKCIGTDWISLPHETGSSTWWFAPQCYSKCTAQSINIRICHPFAFLSGYLSRGVATMHVSFSVWGIWLAFILTMWSWTPLERPKVVRTLNSFPSFYGTQRSNSPVPIMSQTNPVHITPSQLYKIPPNITHLPTSWSS